MEDTHARTRLHALIELWVELNAWWNQGQVSASSMQLFCCVLTTSRTAPHNNPCCDYLRCQGINQLKYSKLLLCGVLAVLCRAVPCFSCHERSALQKLFRCSILLIHPNLSLLASSDVH
eukprot:1160698-Pelagomonas_calceolata.AAC.6